MTTAELEREYRVADQAESALRGALEIELSEVRQRYEPQIDAARLHADQAYAQWLQSLRNDE